MMRKKTRKIENQLFFLDLPGDEVVEQKTTWNLQRQDIQGDTAKIYFPKTEAARAISW
jgi:hypothetical protein